MKFSKNCNIFDEKFYSECYDIPLLEARNHYDLLGKRSNYLTSRRDFILLYPNFSNLSIKEMRRHHEERVDRRIKEIIQDVEIRKETINTQTKISIKVNNIDKQTALLLHIGDLNIFLEDIRLLSNNK